MKFLTKYYIYQSMIILLIVNIIHKFLIIIKTEISHTNFCKNNLH